MLSQIEKKLQEQLDQFHDRLNAEVAAFTKTDKPRSQRLNITDIDEWGTLYTPHYFSSKPADFHSDLDEIVNWSQPSIFAIHGAREHAKSSRIRISLLHKFLNGAIKYWLFGSETTKLAWFHIEYISAELTSNKRIATDYEIKILKQDSVKGILRFSVKNPVTAKKHTVMLQAVSYETGAKGLTFRNLRPQGCFIDDFEDTKSSRNEKIGRLKEEWVRQEVYPAVTGPVIWVGNMGSKTSALFHAFTQVHGKDNVMSYLEQGETPGLLSAKAAEMKTQISQYFALSYRAETRLADGSIRYLWPQRYPPSWYVSKQKVMGSTYAGEMNGRPEARGTIFDEKGVGQYTKLPTEAVWFVWFDPAFGRSKNSCYKSWVAGCYDGQFYYVADAYCKQGTSSSDVIKHLSEAFDRWPLLKQGGFEDAFDQASRFSDDLQTEQEAGMTHLPIYPMPNPGNKFVRCESLEGDWNNGRILWPKQKTTDMDKVIEHVLSYPDGEYIDGLDALEAFRTNVRTNYKRIQTNIKTSRPRRFNFSNNRSR